MQDSFQRAATQSDLILPSLPDTHHISGISIRYVNNSPWKANIDIVGVRTKVTREINIDDKTCEQLKLEAENLGLSVKRIDYPGMDTSTDNYYGLGFFLNYAD